jgi:MoaA/NifB/PqqE/SkfB family radical SAM enzyme
MVKVHFPECSDQIGKTEAELFLLKVTNLLVANFEMRHRRTRLISHPVGMLIDPSNSCALRCPGCVHSGKRDIWDWPPGLLKKDIFQTFLSEQGPFAVELYLANYGEPLLSPMTPSLIRSARRLGLPTFTSSSLSVPARLTSGLVESGLNFLICSIDGASEETYQKYRINGNFDQAIANLKSIAMEKASKNSYTPILHWQFLVFEHNRHEVDRVIQLAKDIGVNQIALVKPFDVTWDNSSIRVDETWESQTIIFHNDSSRHKAHLGKMTDELASDIIDRAFSKSWLQRYLDAVDHDEAEPIVQSSASQKPCNWIYKSLTMDARGRVLPCARPPSRSGDLIFGTFDSEDSFNTKMHRLGRLVMSNTDAYEEARMQSGVVEPYCARCEHRNQKADIDTEETVRQILRDAPLYRMLSESAIFHLTNW